MTNLARTTVRSAVAEENKYPAGERSDGVKHSVPQKGAELHGEAHRQSTL